MNNYRIRWSFVTNNPGETEADAVLDAEEWLDRMFGPLIFSWAVIEQIEQVE